MLAFRPSALLIVLLTLSSCAYAPGGKGFPWEINFSGAVCKKDSSNFIKGVDWNQARVLDIRIRQGHFSPTYLGLYIGQSYILNIENADDVDHSFMAFDFFRAIAVAGVSADGADFKEIKCLAGVTIPPQTKTSLRLVAVRDGTYEFDDDSLVNSLAMIGSGGGFITIEPRRSIIKSPSEHTVLFDYESIVLESERVKVDGQSSINHPLVQNPSVRESSNDPENTQLDQPSKTSEGAKKQQSTDPVEAQSKAITPLPEVPVSEEVIDGPIDKPVSDITHDTSISVEGEFDEKMSLENLPVGKKAPLASTNERELPQPDVPEVMPGGHQFFDGPPADVYSDPPDSVKIRTDSGGASGDSGEDKLESSG
jgi:hypothetical protein